MTDKATVPADGKAGDNQAAMPRRDAAEDDATNSPTRPSKPDDRPAAANSSGHATSGINAQSGQPSAGETERTAPGISTDKKADDTK